MDRSEHGSAALVAPAAVGLVQGFLASRRLHELPDEVFQLGVVWSACEHCVAERDAAAAERLYRLLSGFADCGSERAGGAFWCGAAAHYLGTLASLLARWDVAAAHFEEALRAGAAAGAPLDIRHTQLAYVRMLLARGAPGDDLKAERLLAELIAGLHLVPAAGMSIAADPIGGARPPVIETARDVRRGASRYQFRREGDYWTLVADGRVSRLRSLRGFEYMAELLRHPFEPIYVVDLTTVAVPQEHRFSVEEAAEHGLRVSSETDISPALDRRAREDYRARWRELLVEEAEARRDNDVGRVTRIQREIDMLATQLAAVVATGSGRNGPSLKERARVNVRNCITAALRAIRQHDETLWRHLSNSIKTGTFCCYGPDRPVVWEM